MLTKRIIPCLDVKDGRVVKGVQFLDLVDAGDPVEVAAAYDAQGADELCFLDINATHENRATMFELVARTADRLTIPFSVGGGVRSVDDVRALLRAGADKTSINSSALANPEHLLHEGMVEWDDPDFDPHKVDVGAIERNLANLGRFLASRKTQRQAAE